MKQFLRYFGAVDAALDKICSWGLFLSLGIMIGMTLLNIVLRWFSTTILWVEPLVRQLVFLSAFLGGALATGSRSHIAIDLAGRIFDALGWSTVKGVLDKIILVFCIFAVFWLAYAGYQFTLIEVEYGREEFLGIHSSVLVAIVPCGLLLIGFRFCYQLLAAFAKD